ncbi:hypothetical protein [Aquabacter spiritensis]|uniref:Uncharacterized protein n=1 Tax=Aquabacter spiritensis TaxID=933073 RepID=A0A4R3M813_9HYPH|nr:hypothetical protein [Aquabacter spiritensis]TCT07777.1 hypothetical protein EDC64_101296 [Aquabacter spiritensis]
MTFTINVPVFPMRQEIEARRAKGVPGFQTQAPRRRSRDADGFFELELLPLDQIDSVETTRSRWRRRG